MIAVPPELATAIHDYLVSRPMRETEGLVMALRQCQPVKKRKRGGVEQAA